MARHALILASILVSAAAAAQPIEGALYDAVGTRIGPVDGAGYVFARVGDRIVRLQVGPARPHGPDSSPPDFRLLAPVNKGQLYWTGANCTGAAYIGSDDVFFVTGDVPSVTVVTANGRVNVFSGSPTGGLRATSWLSFREGETCSNFEEIRSGQGLKVDSKIDLGTVFVAPYSLR